MDLLVVESSKDEEDARHKTPEPESGRYPFFDRNVWNYGGVFSASGGATWEEEGGRDESDEEDDESEDSVDLEEDEFRIPDATPVVILDDIDVVSLDIYSFFY